MHLVYKKITACESHWEFQSDGSVYPLYSKFDRNPPLPSAFYNQTIIKAQSIAKDDIQKAIKNYFNPSKNVKLHIIEANEATLEQALNDIRIDTDIDRSEKHYIVIYYLQHLHYTKTGMNLVPK